MPRGLVGRHLVREIITRRGKNGGMAAKSIGFSDTIFVLVKVSNGKDEQNSVNFI